MEKNSILLEARWEIKFPINQLTFMRISWTNWTKRLGSLSHRL